MRLLPAVAALVGAAALPVRGQLPVAGIKASGEAVSPVYEGWYRNADGTFSLSFGYFNRNGDEVVEIPVGPNNFMSPGAQNQGQPTHFQPRRHWGVFAVKVPATFGETAEVTWTLKFRGTIYAIPGRLHANWQIDALEGEAGANNTPPVVKIAGGPESRGPGGAMAGPLAATVGQPLALTAWAADDGRGGGRGAAMVSLAWFKHQGPGQVTFAEPAGRAAASGADVATTATFSAPGTYILRVRANDVSGVANAGHAQCCWTNGFVRVVVK